MTKVQLWFHVHAVWKIIFLILPGYYLTFKLAFSHMHTVEFSGGCVMYDDIVLRASETCGGVLLGEKFLL